MNREDLLDQIADTLLDGWLSLFPQAPEDTTVRWERDVIERAAEAVRNLQDS